MSDKENLVIPFQIQNLLDGMNNHKESEHIRNNYRNTLDSIKNAIETELLKFDAERGSFNIPEMKKGKKNVFKQGSGRKTFKYY